MTNQTQKIQKAQKRFFTKVMLMSFYFLMICYSQCGHAVIEEYLYPGTDGLYKLGTKDSGIRINTMKLAAEVATYLKNGRLCEVYIQLPESGEQDNIRQLILKALNEALQNNTALTTLDLWRSQIGVEGAIALAAALQNNTTLTTLNLGVNHIDAEGARALARALRNNTALTMFGLGRNQIGDEGARVLAELLRNNTALITLNLWENQIGDVGAQVLAEALRNNRTLTSLNFGGNQIDAEGARALAELLRNNTALITLNLAINQIGDAGAQVLAEALRNNTALTMLGLGSNQIGDEGARALAEALRSNTTLTTLNLEYNQIGAEGARTLTTALTDNYTLLEFFNDNGDANKKPLLRNNLLIKLLRKIKRASSFVFTIGVHHTPLRYVSQDILADAGLNVRNRTAFENIQNYNTEGIRDIIFRGSLEEVIKLFYYGNGADYGEILREVNQIRRLQREILQVSQRVIPEGLVELPEDLPGGGLWSWIRGKREQQKREFVTTTFWTS